MLFNFIGVVQGLVIGVFRLQPPGAVLADQTLDGALTVDYGHDNPGTLVDVEVSDGKLAVSQTTLYPPGTFTLSGLVTEMSPAGPVPVEGAYVARAAVGGWQSAKTDKDGFYAIPGLFNASREVESGKSGYVTLKRTVIVSGDTRLDITLTRNP